MRRFVMSYDRSEGAGTSRGGEEVLIVLFATDFVATVMIARRLAKERLDNGRVSFSIGMAACKRNETLEETVNRADRELIKVRVVSRPGTYTRRNQSKDRKLAG